MTDEEYIRKAVELADGWEWCDGGFEDDNIIESLSGYRGSIIATPELKDALAAQLVRQVDALETHRVESHAASVMVYETHYPVNHAIAVRHGPDRTMNTIKAIVDSGVLTATKQGEKDE